MFTQLVALYILCLYLAAFYLLYIHFSKNPYFLLHFSILVFPEDGTGRSLKI